MEGEVLEVPQFMSSVLKSQNNLAVVLPPKEWNEL